MATHARPRVWVGEDQPLTYWSHTATSIFEPQMYFLRLLDAFRKN
jgi:hypothetical protein